MISGTELRKALGAAREACRQVAGRHVLTARDGGAKLRPPIGSKAASLSEIDAFDLELATALSTEIRKEHFPFSELEKDANVLIFPDLQSGNLAMQLLEQTREAVVVGPILMGTSHPVHLSLYGSSVRELFNLTVAGIAQCVGVR
jgi:hypothetical protein